LDAVTISNHADGHTYADIMEQIMSDIDLHNVELEVSSRRTNTRAILLEHKGTEAADKLVALLESSIGNIAKIARLKKTTPAIILDVADWTEVEEIHKSLVDLELNFDSI